VQLAPLEEVSRDFDSGINCAGSERVRWRRIKNLNRTAAVKDG